MKTLTELSGTLIRMAAAAIAEAKRSLPPEPAAAPTPAPEAAPVEAAAVEAAAPEAAAPEGVAPEAPGAAAGEAAAAPAPSPAAEPEESDAVKAALDEAVAKATGLSGDRLARLRDAVKVVGGSVDDVRLVRVFGPEEPVAGAKKLGEFQFLVDHAPRNMKQVMGPPEKKRGGRGGGGRGGGRGGGGGGRGEGAKAGATGGFSMDSLREDRKNQRGGRPGGGRGGPGGRRPGGGGGGGPRGP